MGKRIKPSDVKSYFLKRLIRHFKADPARLAVVEQTFPSYQRPNLHLAISRLLDEAGVEHELEGVVLTHEYESVTLSKLSRDATSKEFLPGPVEYADVLVASDESLACVKRGIYWLRTKAAGPIALLVSPHPHVYPPQIYAEIMAADRDRAQDFGRPLAARVNEGPAFRGQVLSLEMDCHHQLSVRFHRLPQIRREDIILPDDVLRRIDRQTVAFTQHASALLKSGRHLKRGILMYGPPGTGKTLSAMYLASRMQGRTVLILTGGGMNSIEASGQLARALAPVTIILEDVDLIGTMREHQTVGANALLFELLNQMDGLAEDADVLFVLTTNRPEILEPALASRPGRIDQAIEIPLPDAECRQRLLDLYGKGLDLRLERRETFVQEMDGVSAAFIRELLRKAAIFAAEENHGGIVITDAHLDEAMRELTLAGGAMTKRLLGVRAGGASPIGQPPVRDE